MKNLTITVALFFTGVGYVQPLHAQALPDADWGMTKAELIRRSNGRITEVDAVVGDKIKIYGLRFGAKSENGIAYFSYFFTPTSNVLAAMMTEPIDKSKCRDLPVEFKAKLGSSATVTRRGRSQMTVSWLSYSNNTELLLDLTSNKKGDDFISCAVTMRPIGPIR
jgi:hypothetical protein